MGEGSRSLEGFISSVIGTWRNGCLRGEEVVSRSEPLAAAAALSSLFTSADPVRLSLSLTLSSYLSLERTRQPPLSTREIRELQLRRGMDPPFNFFDRATTLFSVGLGPLLLFFQLGIYQVRIIPSTFFSVVCALTELSNLKPWKSQGRVSTHSLTFHLFPFSVFFLFFFSYGTTAHPPSPSLSPSLSPPTQHLQPSPQPSKPTSKSQLFLPSLHLLKFPNRSVSSFLSLSLSLSFPPSVLHLTLVCDDSKQLTTLSFVSTPPPPKKNSLLNRTSSPSSLSLLLLRQHQPRRSFDSFCCAWEGRV